MTKNTRKSYTKETAKKVSKSTAKTLPPGKTSTPDKTLTLGDSMQSMVTPPVSPKKRVVIDYSQRESNETQVFSPKVSANELKCKRL